MKSYVIDTSALQENLRILRQAAHNTVIWGVIKGNGYGLGCTRMAQCLYKQGICHFAVTELQEARGLRQAGFTGTPILILENFCQRSQLAALVDLDCILTVGSAEDARQISKLGLERGMPVPVHVKIDTGMGRYGFLPEQLEQILELYTGYPGLSPEGLYTHFSDAGNPAATQRQFERFRQVVSAIRSQGHLPGMVHCCNSTAFWNYPHMHLDGVRIGSALLGRVPWAEEAGLQRIGFCQASVEELRWIPAGHTVGYGSGWKAKRDTRIAILGIGYFHGFSVSRGFDLWRFSDCLRGIARYVKAFFSKKALYIQLDGQACRVLGHVGMVNTVVDVTDCPCQSGDLAILDINPVLIKDLEIICK